jgi:glutathione S-transferase
MKATLYAVPASHPSLAGQLMLEHKGIEVRRIDMVAGVHRVGVRAFGFPGVTVPAVKIDGQRYQGTRTIALALDALVPERPLFPRDPDRREAVERAESWGDEALQPVPRRIVWAALKRDRSELVTYLRDAKLGIPPALAARTAAPVVALAARLNHATDEAVQRDLDVLPGLLDYVDELLREGVIGADDVTVADYQIATSLRLLLTLEDLRPLFAGRPCVAYAERIAPVYPGHTPRALPAAWLPAAGTPVPA